ncbi:hypothetical protein K504DRAFT_94545 [Pleomassaria siparia CBS 279.74]|uniref:Uncharacterized protein n=1 Tax=Pleomassaria siparia CBS 279.74 TaxID=1314801 RepID=A0A6G1JYV0_9PLEO|nr:hypothetical protein K504DRAFT_94545 [Pleomassaria siparia CBS 279.74]
MTPQTCRRRLCCGKDFGIRRRYSRLQPKRGLRVGFGARRPPRSCDQTLQLANHVWLSFSLIFLVQSCMSKRLPPPPPPQTDIAGLHSDKPTQMP